MAKRMTDDECIVTALLRGADLWYCPHEGWYIYAHGRDHALEKERWAKRMNGWNSRAACARAYCKFEKLLPEVTE